MKGRFRGPAPDFATFTMAPNLHLLSYGTQPGAGDRPD
jgi:hypothetical protein